MVRICLRDESALHVLHAVASGKVFAAALRIVRQHELADEVVSACFLQAWHTAGTFDFSRATVITWLLTIARSRAIDALRRHRVRCEHECTLDDDDEGPRLGATDPSARSNASNSLNCGGDWPARS